MLHRLRLAVQNGSPDKLARGVEADETFIGDKSKNMHQARHEGAIQGYGSVSKAVIMGILNWGEEYTEKSGRRVRAARNGVPETRRSSEEEGHCLTRFECFSGCVQRINQPLQFIFTTLCNAHCRLSAVFIVRVYIHPSLPVLALYTYATRLNSPVHNPCLRERFS